MARVSIEWCCRSATRPRITLTRASAVALARGCNDLYVDLHARHAQRFNAFIGLPMPHVDASLAELQRGLGLPGVLGVGLGCSVLGRPLDDPAFEPVFAELDRRRTVTFLHPIGAGGGPNSDDFGMTWMLASRFEDTIAMARLILSGLTLRFPNIRFIVPHLGGTLGTVPAAHGQCCRAPGLARTARPGRDAEQPRTPLLVRHGQRTAFGPAVCV